MRRIASPVLLIGVTTLGMSAGAQAGDYVLNHWKCNVTSEDQIPVTVPVGCDIVDSALGCPSGSALAMTVTFAAPPGFSAEFGLVNPPTAMVPAVGSSAGSAHRVNSTRIRMTPGTAVFSGFAADSAPAPSLAIRIVTSVFALGTENPVVARLMFRQFVGAYAVGQTTVRDSYYSCTKARAVDSIQLADNTASTGAVALLDGRRNDACMTVDELGFRGIPLIPLPNMKLKGACVERAVVFSSDNAVAFMKQMSAWKDCRGDKVTQPLKGLVKPPVKLWVLWNRCATGSCGSDETAEMASRPQRHKDHATLLWRQAFGGLSFAEAQVTDLSGAGLTEPGGGAINWPALRCFDGSSTRNLVNKFMTWTGQTPEAYAKYSNVFYVHAFGPFGKWCGDYTCPADERFPAGRCGRDTIILRENAELETLAHELGHALLDSGNHADPGVDGFTSDSIPNLMKGNAYGEHLTLGQLFRASLYSESITNRHNARAGGETASCSAVSTSVEACPEHTRDVSPR